MKPCREVLALSAGAASRADLPPGLTTGCPFPHHRPDAFADWLENGLQCAAGKREFKLGRYQVARVRGGSEYRTAFDEFRRGVSEMRKTGFLAIFVDPPRAATAQDELRFLGEAMREAGLTDNVDELIAGRTLATPIDVICPVTGEETAYEFFSVAFCEHSNNPRDELYDPSLSAPFRAINTTSDAFAFARLVNDQSMRVFDRAPYEMVQDRAVPRRPPDGRPEELGSRPQRSGFRRTEEVPAHSRDADYLRSKALCQVVGDPV